VLLATGGGSFAGLAGAASADHQPVRAAAAAGVTPLPVALPKATYAKDLDLVEPGTVPDNATKVAAKERAARAVAAARASRTRREAPPAPAGDNAVRPSDGAATESTEDARDGDDTPSVRAARPAVGGLTSRSGPRWGRMHKGLDFGSAYGSSIRAVRSGQVISAGYDGGYGNMVMIEHADGVVTAYAHMSRILVRGGWVSAGEVIGRVGSTGHSTGPHLHFEVRVGGRQINPLPWLRAQGVDI
jgi:murein DD-endopeptidase MepM/ murein hydrolase activator NlpD